MKIRMYVPSKVSGTSFATVPISGITREEEEEEEEEEDGNIIFKLDSSLFSVSLSVIKAAWSSTSTSTSTALEVEVEVVESENKDLLFDRKCAIATPFILPPFNGEEKVPMSSKSPGVSDEEK